MLENMASPRAVRSERPLSLTQRSSISAAQGNSDTGNLPKCEAKRDNAVADGTRGVNTVRVNTTTSDTVEVKGGTDCETV